MQTQQPTPRALIEASGKTIMDIAVASGVSLMTVLSAKKHDRWPTQRRTREGLMRALGVLVAPGQAAPAVPVAAVEGGVGGVVHGSRSQHRTRRVRSAGR